MKKIINKIITSLISLFLMTQSCYAGISLDKNRIVFSQNNHSQSVSVNNDTDKLYLIQSNVIENLNDENSDNFLTIPPIARLEPQSNNIIKVMPKNLSSLPNDRESLFYFTVSLIPESKKQTQAENHDQIGMKFSVVTKMIIKLFYRPISLIENPEKYADKLEFDMQGNSLKIKNPSPYYLTLVNLKLDNIEYISDISPMVAPFSTFEINTKKQINNISWQIINDYGGYSNVFNKKIER